MMFFNVSKKICLRDAVFAFLLLNLYSHYRSVWTCGWMSEQILCVFLFESLLPLPKHLDLWFEDGWSWSSGRPGYILEKRLRALREGGVGFGLSTIDNCETN